jgi:beta-galactosidase
MKIVTRCAAAVAAVLCLASLARAADDRTTSFDADWRFHLGDTPGADAPAFDDGGWRKLDVPHDWMIEGPPGKDPSLMEGPFDPKSPGGAGNGYLDGGVGWYRKHFAAPAQRGHVAVQFDGVYMNSHVWLNGHDLGVHPYGYTSFEYDLTPYLIDGDNVIAVRTEVVQPCSRFYSGGGIYRHVWLTATGPVHVDHWGTHVTSEVKETSDAKDNDFDVTARTRVANDGPAAAEVTVESVVLGPSGHELHFAQAATTTVPAGHTAEVSPVIVVSHAKLWSIEQPVLYTLSTDVKVGGKVVDHADTPFGIRTVEFTVDHGMMLNGQHVPIRGVCDHHDLGVLGAAVNTRAIQRQLEILKSFGCNAIRTSHYPPAPELLDLCDKMGFVVMDEAFDEWKNGKTRNGYGRFFDDWSERDITSMVDRDRNHPSVVLWSIGNEIKEQGAKNGQAMSQRLSDLVHREDPTRPTTSAMSSPDDATKSGFDRSLGVFGVNYHIYFYTDDRIHGHMPMVGSETASALSSRGEYGLALGKAGVVTIRKEFDHQVTDYDLVGPRWGNTAQASLMAFKKDPWMAGEFVWTGFDYIGEPTPYDWPSRSSYFGIVDLCGFPKDRYYLYQSQWTDKPMVHLLPHWNWPQFAGKDIPVWCYTNCDAVELFLNGRSLGEETKADRKELHLEWSVPFEPGTLKAVAKKGGVVVATDEVRTAGKPQQLTLTGDRTALKAGVRDLSFVTVGAVDADHVKCPTADDEVTFTVTGPATIAGVGDGDPTNHEPFQGSKHKLFNGLGLVVLQAGDQTGTVTLTATAEGMQPATAQFTVGQ